MPDIDSLFAHPPVIRRSNFGSFEIPLGLLECELGVGKVGSCHLIIAPRLTELHRTGDASGRQALLALEFVRCKLDFARGTRHGHPRSRHSHVVATLLNAKQRFTFFEESTRHQYR